MGEPSIPARSGPAASIRARSLSFTNLSKNVEAARGGSKRSIATLRAHSLALDELGRKSAERIAAYKAQQVLQLAAVRGNRVETATVRARGIVQLAALKREDLSIKARQKVTAAALSALSGGKKSIAMFRTLGISQDDLAKGSHDFQFLLLRVAEGLKQVHGGTKKAALAQRLFGRSSQTTLPIFAQGRKTLQANLALADKYGVTLSKNPLKASLQLARAQKEMEFAQLGWQVTFATKVAPALTKLILLVTRGSQWLSKHKSITSILIPALISFAAATWLVNVAMSANPAVLLVAGLVAVGVAVVLAYKHFKGFRAVVNGVFGWIKSHWPLVTGILTGGLVPAIAYVIRHWEGILNFFTGLPGKIKKKTLGLFDGVKDAFRSAINWVIGIWNRLRFTIPKIDTHIPGVGKVGGWSIGTPHIDPIGGGGGVTKGYKGPDHSARMGRAPVAPSKQTGRGTSRRSAPTGRSCSSCTITTTPTWTAARLNAASPNATSTHWHARNGHPRASRARTAWAARATRPRRHNGAGQGAGSADPRAPV